MSEDVPVGPVFEIVDAPALRRPIPEPWDASPRTCPRCAAPFTPRRRTQKYCSPHCKPSFERDCARCSKTFVTSTKRKVYCGVACREKVKAERYAESARARYGDDIPGIVQTAIDIKRHFASRGGYSVRGRTLSPGSRRAVIERDLGMCQVCGEPGTEVDHIGLNHGDLESLQLLCRECHAKKTIPMLAFFMRDEPGISVSIQLAEMRLARAASEPEPTTGP